MRTRTILAALGTGVLAALTLSAPAHATTVMSPTVTYTDRCNDQGSFKAHVTLPINAETATVRITRNGTLIPDGGPGGYVTSVSAGGAFDYAFGSGAPGEAAAEKGTIALEWKSGNAATYSPLAANSTHKWSVPDSCKPAVLIFQPTCANPALGVGIANSGVTGVTAIDVTFNANTATTIAAGTYKLFDGAVKTDITYSWESAALGISGGETVKYVAPAGCTAGQPGVNPTPETPSIHEGKGRPQHISWKNHGKTATTTKAPAGAETTTTAPAGAVTTTTTKKAAAAGKGDNLAVTGTNTKAVVGVGFLLFAGGLVLLLAIRRRRQVRFTA